MRVNHIYAVAASAVFAAAVPKQQGSVDAIIDKAVATYAKTKTSKGTFDQAITNPLTGIYRESERPVRATAAASAVLLPLRAAERRHDHWRREVALGLPPQLHA